MFPHRRYIRDIIKSDLKEKMVFVGGPRQVGKTTLALDCLSDKPQRESHPAYQNWDHLDDRKRLLNGQFPSKQPIIILDEIHKFADWRNLVKGFYDKHKTKVSFLVTGSARLDYYRKGGDSLQGRYHYHRLHPFTLNELDNDVDSSQLKNLLKFGGFPEPLFKGEERFHRRWLRDYSSRLLYDDLRALERVQEISKVELLLHHLPECVASPLSINALCRHLSVAHETVSNWIAILERLYCVYRIAPYGHKKIRAVKKESKLYFWDWSKIQEPGIRFENFVASHLLKYCHFIEDTEGYAMELRFVRDTDKREIDFVVLRDGQPEFAVEVKTGDHSPSKHLNYFRERTDIKRFYQVHLADSDYGDEDTDVRVLPFAQFCKELGLP